MIRTRELFEYARQHPRKPLHAGNGGEGFMQYPWLELKRALGHNRVGEKQGDRLVSPFKDWPAGTAIQDSLLGDGPP